MPKYTNPRTKKEALEMCLLMWEYIAEEGCSKYTAVKELELPALEARCAACDYALTKFKEEYPEDIVRYSLPEKCICEFCPISAWNTTEGISSGCYSIDSPFRAWYNSDYGTPENKQYAQQIVQLIQADIAKLTDKDSEE